MLYGSISPLTISLESIYNHWHFLICICGVHSNRPQMVFLTSKTQIHNHRQKKVFIIPGTATSMHLTSGCILSFTGKFIMSYAARGPLFLVASYLVLDCKEALHCPWQTTFIQSPNTRIVTETKSETRFLSFNLMSCANYRTLLLWFSLTSRQADGSTAMILHKVLRANVNVLLAQPPQAKMGCLAGRVCFFHLRAEHCPVVRYHRCEHASHTHQHHEDGNLYLCSLVHVSRRVDFLFSEYSSLDMKVIKKVYLLNWMLCNVGTPLVWVPGASFLSDCSKLPRMCRLVFSLSLRLLPSLPLLQICASGSKGKGPDCSCPRYKSPSPYSLWVAAQLMGLQV